MKKCSTCKIEKADDQFNKSTWRKDGLSNNCKECNKAKLKEHYYNNTTYYLEKNNRRKDDIKEYIRSKRIACVNCGESHIACLDFHHETEKSVNISEMVTRMWSRSKIDEELNKCIVLCSNCHRKLHYEERQLGITVVRRSLTA